MGDVRSLEEVIRRTARPEESLGCARPVTAWVARASTSWSLRSRVHQAICTPNALLTLKEYLIDYASPETRAEGAALIGRELAALAPGDRRRQLEERLAAVEGGQPDLHF